MEEGDVSSSRAAVEERNGTNVNGSGDGVWVTFQRSFTEVESLLDQNRDLIREINENQENKASESLARNVGLIKELNTNISQVVELYSNLSSEFAKSMGETSPQSGGEVSHSKPMNAEKDESDSSPHPGRKKLRPDST